MAVKVMDTKADVKLRVLAYGIPGSGKTTFCGTAALDPRTAPALHVDMGGNAMVLTTLSQTSTILTMDKLEDFNQMYDWLSKGQSPEHRFAKETGLGKDGIKFKTFVFDGFTGLQRESFALATGSSSAGPGSIPDRIERPHFNAVLGHMVKFATYLYRLPMHVIATALERETSDQNGAVTMYKPMLLGQAADEVAGYAYVVMRMVHRLKINPNQLKAAEQEFQQAEDVLGAGQVVSVGLLAPSGRYVAKDQHGIKKPFLVNPSVTQMLDAMGVTK